MRGAALSGIAAEGLEAGSGISSRTLASLEFAWNAGRETLTSRDVLVVDEAGLVGSRQMARVLDAARAAGARLMSERNKRALGAGFGLPGVAVKSGTLGTVPEVADGAQRLTVRLDGPGSPGAAAKAGQGKAGRREGTGTAAARW